MKRIPIVRSMDWEGLSNVVGFLELDESQFNVRAFAENLAAGLGVQWQGLMGNDSGGLKVVAVCLNLEGDENGKHNVPQDNRAAVRVSEDNDNQTSDEERGQR